MGFIEFVDLYGGVMVFVAVTLAGCGFMVRQHIKWGKEDRRNQERGR